MKIGTYNCIRGMNIYLFIKIKNICTVVIKSMIRKNIKFMRKIISRIIYCSNFDSDYSIDSTLICYCKFILENFLYIPIDS